MKKPEESERECALRIRQEVWEDLSRQAKILGYHHGCVTVYIRDRLVQLAEERTFNLLPAITPSWPPPGPGARKGRGRKPRLWFVQEKKAA
jgi:hypothetical protein